MKTQSLAIVAFIAAIAGGVFYWYKKSGPGKATSNDRDTSEFPASAEINSDEKPAPVSVSDHVKRLPKVPSFQFQTGGGYPITPVIETDYQFDQKPTQNNEGVLPVHEDFPRIAVL